MSHFHEYFLTMHDGTIKHINPFTGTEVWSVPGRRDKPIMNVSPRQPIKLSEKKNIEKEDYCHFCSKRHYDTPPEKERVIKKNGSYKIIPVKTFDELNKTYAFFKRVPNLFEIITYNYWKENFNYKIPQSLMERKYSYLSTSDGQDHVLNVLNYKLEVSGIDPDSIPDYKKLEEYADPFFAGCHELIIGGRHYKENAETDLDLCSSGELTPEEHFEYIKFTIHSLQDILQKNRFVRYVTVFQNWLSPAGASFDHLHKQLVGLDEWGTSIEKKIETVSKNKNAYNEYGANLAAYNDFIIAENDFAIAFADIGHRYPTLAIYSKSVNPYPSMHTAEELQGMSDLLHACHCAMGNQLSCNEEWYYAPYDTINIIPWHIMLKWRINTPAGFEGGTEIFINPISPIMVRDNIVPRLYSLREEGIIRNIKIAEECVITHNPLKYYRYSS